jgi:hypothetical protein
MVLFLVLAYAHHTPLDHLLEENISGRNKFRISITQTYSGQSTGGDYLMEFQPELFSEA